MGLCQLAAKCLVFVCSVDFDRFLGVVGFLLVFLGIFLGVGLLVVMLLSLFIVLLLSLLVVFFMHWMGSGVHDIMERQSGSELVLGSLSGLPYAFETLSYFVKEVEGGSGPVLAVVFKASHGPTVDFDGGSSEDVGVLGVLTPALVVASVLVNFLFELMFLLLDFLLLLGDVVHSFLHVEHLGFNFLLFLYVLDVVVPNHFHSFAELGYAALQRAELSQQHHDHADEDCDDERARLLNCFKESVLVVRLVALALGVVVFLFELHFDYFYKFRPLTPL